jgi:hypothetical protein
MAQDFRTARGLPPDAATPYDAADLPGWLDAVRDPARLRDADLAVCDEYGVPQGCTHFLPGIFGSVQFLQRRESTRRAYFAEYTGERWEPMGTQPSAVGATPRDIADYHRGLPHDEFQAVMHAAWLADGDAARAAASLGVAEDRIWQMNAGQADAAFCSRPGDWQADASRAWLAGWAERVAACATKAPAAAATVTATVTNGAAASAPSLDL